jgi:hypothetical protein
MASFSLKTRLFLIKFFKINIVRFSQNKKITTQNKKHMTIDQHLGENSEYSVPLLVHDQIAKQQNNINHLQ